MRRLKKKEKFFRSHVRQMVKSQFFYWSVIVCVFLNTVLMSVEHYGQPKWLEKFQGLCLLTLCLCFKPQINGTEFRFHDLTSGVPFGLEVDKKSIQGVEASFM